MRITHGMLAETTLRNLNANMARLEKLQNQLTTGRRISRPSDDPIAVARALNYHTAVDETGQYRRNIDAATGWLDATDSALDAAIQSLQRARELAIQGATDSLSAEDRRTMSVEVKQLKEHLIQVGNTTFGPDYLFAGQLTTSAPFDASGAYSGGTAAASTDAIQREIGVGVSMQVNVTGDVVFTPAFAAVQALADGLDADDRNAVDATIGSIDQALETLMVARSEVGAKVNRLEKADARLADLEVNQTGLLSKEEDVDMTEAIMSYAVAENVYKASLSAGSRAIQPSLLDYLR